MPLGSSLAMMETISLRSLSVILIPSAVEHDGGAHALAHGGDEAAVLLAIRKRGSVRAAIYHARLIDAHVHHEFCPHAAANVLFNHMGDTGALKQAGDVFNNARLGVRRRA